MFKRNLKFGKPLKISAWRKSALGSYSLTGDSTVYGIQQVVVSKVLNEIAKQNESSSQKITLTHFLGKVCAIAIEKNPQINTVIRLGKIYPRDEISIFFQVAVDDQGEDLSGATVRDINKISVEEIAEILNGKSKNIKSGNDKDFQKTKNIMKLLPGILMRPIIKLLGFILYSLNLWTPLLGMPKDNFGSMMITNIGTLGVQTGLVPLVDFSRAPLILAAGAVYEDVLVKDGNISPDKFINLCWSFDHRLIDGVVAAKIGKVVEYYFENPAEVFKRG